MATPPRSGPGAVGGLLGGRYPVRPLVQLRRLQHGTHLQGGWSLLDLLSLDWRLSEKGFAWADAVIAENPTLPVVLTTHEIVGSYDDGTAGLSDYGRQMWDDLIKDNDQIFVTLNGHYWPPGRTVLKSTAGNGVHLHVTNYQDRYGGAGMIRSYRFDLSRGRIDVATFSPWIRELAAKNELNELAAQELGLTSPVDSFSMALDFDPRFAGFAPVPPRASRPAGRMPVSGTLAYWRFDEGGTAGSDVAAGTVVKDLPGGASRRVRWRCGRRRRRWSRR